MQYETLFFQKIKTLKPFNVCWIQITIVLLTMLNIACEHNSGSTDNQDHNINLDSTYNPLRDSITLYVDVKREEYLNIPAMDNWNNIVRLRGESGWGTFDYICSIYNEENKRIQLIRQNRWYHEGGVNYTYNERILTDSEYQEIMAMLDSIGYYEMPFDLEPDRLIIDGSEYTLAVKNGEYTKVVFWQDEIRIDSDNKRKIMGVFKDILRRANYPYPRGFIMRSSEITDSVSYRIGLDGYDLTMDYYAECNNVRLPKKEGMPSFTIAVLDTSLLRKMIDIYIIMGDGQIHKIEDEVIEN